MKRRLLDLHLYLGLLCAPYLVVYGVSSISFNHDWVAAPTTSHREATLEATSTAEADAQERAEAYRAELDLMGWIPAHSIKLDERGLRFRVNRPGMQYRVEVAESGGHARIEERRSGVLAVLRGLHGMREVPGSLVATLWGLYTELSVWVLVFAVGSGIYLWYPRREALGWILLGGGSVVTLLLSVAVW